VAVKDVQGRPSSGVVPGMLASSPRCLLRLSIRETALIPIARIAPTNETTVGTMPAEKRYVMNTIELAFGPPCQPK